MKYDLSTGLSERLTYGSRSVYLNDISPDGKKLLCSTSKSNITKCPFTLSSLFEIDLSTLKADTLVKWDAYMGGASYSPDGKKLLLTGGPDAFGGIGRNCGSHPIANSFDTQAFVLDPATQKIDPITRDFDPTVTPLQWNRGDGCIYFNTTDGDCRNIYRYSLKTGRFEKLPLEEDVIYNFSLAKDNPSVAAYVEEETPARVRLTYMMPKENLRFACQSHEARLGEDRIGQDGGVGLYGGRRHHD